MHRQIAGKLTGRVTKWIVLVAWIVAFVGLGSLSVQARSTSRTTRRPPGCPATRRVDPGAREARAVPGPQRHPDRRRLRAPRPASPRTTLPRPWPSRPPRFQAMDGVDGEVALPTGRQAGSRAVVPRTGRSPRPSSPSTSARTAGTTCPTAADELRDIAQIDGVDDLHRRLRRPGRRLVPRRSRASTATCSLAALGVVIMILLFTYRSPILWMLPIFSAVVALLTSPGRHLLPRQVRRPHGQRPEPGDPDHPGDRRRHRLRPAAGRAISRRAAAPRGPARGDGVRAAPRRPGDPRQRRHRRGRHALPAVRRDELHRRARPGQRRSASASPSW